MDFSDQEIREIQTGRPAILDDPHARGLDLGGMSEHDGVRQYTEVEVFTDGSCHNNGKKNSLAGMGIHFPSRKNGDYSVPYYGYIPAVNLETGLISHVGPLRPEEGRRSKVTNQRAELTAIYLAIQLAAIWCLGDRVHVKVMTDSEYCINSLTDWCFKWRDNDWKTANGKPVKNRDIIEPILALMKQYRVTFFHVAAHTNNQDARSIGNARADWLATQATAKQRK